MAHGQASRPLESEDGTKATIVDSPSGDGTAVVVTVDRPVAVTSKAAFLEQIGVTRRRTKLFGKRFL